jgi:hypothetical protein
MMTPIALCPFQGARLQPAHTRIRVLTMTMLVVDGGLLPEQIETLVLARKHRRCKR